MISTEEDFLDEAADIEVVEEVIAGLFESSACCWNLEAILETRPSFTDCFFPNKRADEAGFEAAAEDDISFPSNVERLSRTEAGFFF